ncbi:MAG TPA: hypothetical protein VMU04_08865 [Candidatus Acidoferrum sp.]|nr:hypothetical protein [Candidatus Acidoferrum sp.]
MHLAVGPLMEVPADIEFHPIVSCAPVVITRGHPLVGLKKPTLQDINRYPPSSFGVRHSEGHCGKAGLT